MEKDYFIKTERDETWAVCRSKHFTLYSHYE